MTTFNCSNCNKELLKGDREYSEKYNDSECTECRFHLLNNTRTIEEYNKWLKK